MMEMLAEKRIRREQDALDAHAANGHTNHYPRQPGVLPHTHSHADQNLPPEEDEEYDDDEEEYSDDEYDDDEEDEMVRPLHSIILDLKLTTSRTL